MVLKIVSRWFLKFFFLLYFGGCNHASLQADGNSPSTSQIKFEPKKYVVYKANQSINIDGKLDDKEWNKAEWTDYFIDIRGNTLDIEKKTRAKILWSDEYLYVGGELKEKDIWGTMEERNSPLFLDNAFEVFIDPDGDSHNYLEFEINALSTIWDLLLTRPGRDRGYSISNFNMLNLKSAVNIYGTINNAQSEDNKWTLEIAFPMEALKELKPRNQPTRAGDQWRIQFARAQRQLEVVKGKYRLKKNPDTGDPLNVLYTSWTPQGIVNLHYPEMWGYIQFSDKAVGEGATEFDWKKQEDIKWALRKVYYQLREYYISHGSYTKDVSKLHLEQIQIDGFDFNPQIQITKSMFEVASKGFNKDTTWVINQDGKLWSR